jgi:hypothetical protein
MEKREKENRDASMEGGSAAKNIPAFAAADSARAAAQNRALAAKPRCNSLWTAPFFRC